MRDAYRLAGAASAMDAASLKLRQRLISIRT
jgi:hypothetical protein